QYSDCCDGDSSSISEHSASSPRSLAGFTPKEGRSAARYSGLTPESASSCAAGEDTVAVVIDGELPIASRHELRDADRARVRALHAEHVGPVLAREQQVALELRAEELAAVRRIEGERRERVDDA